VRIAVDVGSVRVGVARSDPAGLLASPLATLRRDPRAGADLTELARRVRADDAVEVLVGLPVALSGRSGAAADEARSYAGRLAAAVAPVPVRLVDERLTTVAAGRALRSAGVPGRKQRPRIDAAAACLLLQGALDHERRTGRPPGELATT
jgi:putative Holliday junction resolvase